MPRNFVNIQYTGAAIKSATTVSISQLLAPVCALACALRKPRAAHTKHRAQLKIKPMRVINAALSNMPADIQAKPAQ